MVAAVKHNAFVQDLARKVHDLNGDTFKLALSNTSPAAADTYGAMGSELVNGNGYTTGGLTLAGVSAVQTAGSLKFTATTPVLTATAAMAAFRYALLYNNTAGSKQALLHWDYGSSITLANIGDTASFTIPGTGILTIA